MRKVLIIAATVLCFLTNANADDKRIIPKHAHVGSDGFFYCDAGYISSPDLSRCIPKQLVDVPALLAPGNNQRGGQLEEYAPRDCELTGLGTTPQECEPMQLESVHDVKNGNHLFREYAPPER
jgi:hypothetical protein